MVSKKSNKKRSTKGKAPRKKVDAKTKKRAEKIYDKLADEYPKAKCALEHGDAWELLAATILSAQCTDERVNMVTPELFKKWPGPKQMAGAEQEDVEEVVRSTGFYRQKAKSLIAAASGIVEKHGGEVPDTMEDLTSLRGVARKTANVVLGNAYGKNVGVVVDTHVRRLTNRMGFTKQQDPVKIEQDLMATFPQDDWTMLSHLLIWHGRKVCKARKPACDDCVVNKECPQVGVEQKQG